MNKRRVRRYDFTGGMAPARFNDSLPRPIFGVPSVFCLLTGLPAGSIRLHVSEFDYMRATVTSISGRKRVFAIEERGGYWRPCLELHEKYADPKAS